MAVSKTSAKNKNKMMSLRLQFVGDILNNHAFKEEKDSNNSSNKDNEIIKDQGN